ncbi:MAG: DUF1566 domain-containing protein, partial [Syntrophales bacterium LBB04]|nr:DUF1566 domain-containing protein [Syntrophales bacterium LBB04]
DRTTNWIMADDITSNIKLIASRHILIVSDSCYSGTLARAANTELKDNTERDAFIKKMLERPSRTLMSSGGNEPVADSGGGKNSVFAAAFLKALNEPEKNTFTTEELFHGRVKEIVAGKADQVPEYNNIKNSGHEGGDFVFQLAKAITKETKSPVSVPDVQLTAPSGSGFSMDDLEKKGQQVEANKAAWEAKLAEMKKAYKQVQAYDKKSVTPDLKVAAWERFGSSFDEDNPYSTEDDSMSGTAQERVQYWQAQKTKTEQQIAMAPRPKAEKSFSGRTGERFSLNGGVIEDSQLGLQWAPSNGQSMDHYKAEEYAQNLSLAGGGWRLPTRAELRSLYDTSKPTKIDPVFNIDRDWVWTSELDGSSFAWGFTFSSGYEYRAPAAPPATTSAFWRCGPVGDVGYLMI